MTDEIMQDLDRLLRTGFTGAAQVAEQLRRRAAEQDRRRRDADLAGRQAAAERAKEIQQAARGHYAKVGWADWQDQAGLADWASAYQHAHAMRDHDPLAATAHNRIEQEVRRRYNIDIREALQLHLQQVAEDQRIRAERDLDATTNDLHAQPDDQTVPRGEDQAADRTAKLADERAGDAEDRTAESGSARYAPTPGHDRGEGEGGPGVDNDGHLVIPGEVVSEQDMTQARTAAGQAADGFGQRAHDAVRHSRTGRRSRKSTGSPRRGARQTADLRRGR